MTIENKEINSTQPLVSIVVITYNSSKYVLETLESAKAQTYQNIELIISDDCSTDDTVEICRLWIEENKERFVNAQLLTVEKNTGIAPNCNRGLNASKGEWVKYFAGDDVLLEDCINILVEFVTEEKDCKVLFAQSAILNNNSDYLVPIHKNSGEFFKLSAKNQFKQILKSAPLNPQGSFYNRLMLEQVDGFEESYPFCEDAPLYLKLSENGYILFGIESIVALYRRHDNNISGTSKKNYINILYYKSFEKFTVEKVVPALIKRGMLFTLLNQINIILVYRAIILFGNKNNLTSKLISYFFIYVSLRRIKSRFFVKADSST